MVVVDINNERLRLAKEMGADETINSLEVDLKTEVMKMTNGDGFPRLVEASGASKLVNNCFQLLQKVFKISPNILENVLNINVQTIYLGCPIGAYWTTSASISCGRLFE